MWDMPTGHFWFMISLVYVYILFPLLKNLFDNNPKLLMIFLAVIALIGVGASTINRFQNIISQYILPNYVPVDINFLYNYLPGTYYFSLIYFMLGGYLHKYFYLERRKLDHALLISVLMIIIGSISIYIEKGLLTGFDGNQFAVYPNGYESMGTLIMSTGMFLFVLRIMDGERNQTKFDKIMEIVSVNTLGIYYIHVIIGAIGSFTYAKINCYGIVANSIKVLIYLLVCLLIIFIGKKIPIIKNFF